MLVNVNGVIKWYSCLIAMQRRRLVALLVVCVIFGFSTLILLVISFQLREELNTAKNETRLVGTDCNAELQQKNEELKRCISGEAQMSEQTLLPYNFSTLGIYSPLFVNKQVETTTFEYNQNIIQKQSLVFEDTPEKRWGVDVWQLASDSNNLQRLSNVPVSMSDFPVFDGYEFRLNNPEFVSARIARWDTANQYKNPQDITMHESARTGPKEITATSYEFLHPFDPSGHPSLVVIWNSVTTTGNELARQPSDPVVQTSRDELRVIADTITFRPPTMNE